MAEAVDMGGDVWTEVREHFLVEFEPFSGELVEDSGLGMDVVEDQAVGDQVIVFDDLSLALTVVFCDLPATTEQNPLDEGVEGFVFVGGRLDHSA